MVVRFATYALLLLGAIVFAGWLFQTFGNPRVEKPQGVNLFAKTAEAQDRFSFEVVSFNAHLLPKVARPFVGQRGESAYRVTEIAKVLRKSDLIGISEAFDEELSAALIDGFNKISNRQFAFLRSPMPRSSTQFVSGGLVLFSRFPIVAEETMTFSSGSRLLSSGFKSADGVAAKGAIFARVRLPRTSVSGRAILVDCFLTHLDSHSAGIRSQQLAELASFIDKNRKPESLFVLMGDFNISGPEQLSQVSGGEYLHLQKLLRFDRFGIRDLAIEPFGASSESVARGTADALIPGSRRIDYLFLGLPESGVNACGTGFRTLPLLDEKVHEGSLSDHAAVWAEVKFSKE